jgi:hypothetical protein
MVVFMASKGKEKSVVEKHNAGVAAIISFVCMLILSAPAVGYFYIDDAKKGIEYLIAAWVLLGIVVIAYFVAGMATYGLGLCCFPIFIIPVAFDLLIVWDVYLQAKGEQPKLPTF